MIRLHIPAEFSWIIVGYGINRRLKSINIGVLIKIKMIFILEILFYIDVCKKNSFLSRLIPPFMGDKNLIVPL